MGQLRYFWKLLQASEPRETRFTYDMADKAMGRACLRDGWHISADDEVWSGAPECRLHIALPGNDVSCCVRIGLAPLIVPHLVPQQRLTLRSGDVVLGEYRVLEATMLLVHVPLSLTRNKHALELHLSLPDAMPMHSFARSDADLHLGIMLESIRVEEIPARLTTLMSRRNDLHDEPPVLAHATRFNALSVAELENAIAQEFGQTPAQLMSEFESLGDNCAFGLAQRKAGCEVIGLLRFANTPLRNLLRGFDDEFRAVTDKNEIELWLHPAEPREYTLRVQRYGIRWHTMQHEGEAEAAAVLHGHSTKLLYAHRKFHDGLKNGRKTYVLARAIPREVETAAPPYDAPHLPPDNGRALAIIPAWDIAVRFEEDAHALTVPEVLPVLLELHKRRAANLLYLVAGERGRASGTVEALGPDLMRGFIKSFVIEPHKEKPHDSDWLRLAANAKWLQREMLAGSAG